MRTPGLRHRDAAALIYTTPMARLPAMVLAVLVAGGCGDNLPQVNEFELVGHTDLGARRGTHHIPDDEGRWDN